MSRPENGFTLIEIMLSVLILASGLVVLIGLQASSITAMLVDRERFRAALVARRILAQLEGAERLPSLGEREGTPSEILATVNPQGDPLGASDDLFYRVRYRLEAWAPEGLAPDLLRRLTLVVTWGDRDEQALEMVFFPVVVANSSEDAELQEDLE